MRPRPLAAALAVTIALFMPGLLRAATRPAGEQEKIDFLISEVQHSQAVFIRNGSEYGGEKAASHLKSKLWFAGKRVQTARDFIMGVASHSEESGKPYEIRVKGAAATRPLGDWLVERLVEYEKGATPLRKKR
jgi:hypothetical protein